MRDELRSVESRPGVETAPAVKRQGARRALRELELEGDSVVVHCGEKRCDQWEIDV